MEKDKSLTAHLFICTNKRDTGLDCHAKGGAALRDATKLACKKPEWRGKLRVNAAGCLGQCEHGIAAVLYPSGEWFLNLKADDSAKLVDAVSKALDESRS